MNQMQAGPSVDHATRAGGTRVREWRLGRTFGDPCRFLPIHALSRHRAKEGIVRADSTGSSQPMSKECEC